MKKLLYCAAALATLLFAASCQQEKLEPVGGPVTFTVTAPGGLDTRAIADGENVNEVHWAVYRTTKDYVIDDTDEIDGALAQGVVPMSNKTATVELDLLQDQYYTILFWAQVKDAGHYELGDLREVKIKYNPLYGNDESRAAFFQRHDFSTFSQQNYDVTLYRPFAQINLGTTAESLTPSQDGQTQGYTIDVRESKMTVKGLATSFDLLKGEGKDEAVEFTFNSTPTPAKNGQTLTVNDTDYHYIAMNYLIVPILDKTVEVSYEITTDKGVVTNTIGSVPIKENYRTNIIGNLLTSKTEFEIVVDKEFNKPDLGPDYIWGGEVQAVTPVQDENGVNVYNISTAAELAWVAQQVNSGAQTFASEIVRVVSDIDLNNQPWTPIGDCNSGHYFQGTFDGNGQTISNLQVDNSTDPDEHSTSGLFGWVDRAMATVRNVNVDYATVKGSHWTGVIAGYFTGRIEGCTVTNSTVIGYNVNGEANGDKIGGIVGYLNEHSYLNENTVSNTTISGNRDLGGIAGSVAASTLEMKGNTVNDVVITYATPKDYASAGIFVSGRTGYVPNDTNTYSNVNIATEVNSDSALAAAIANGTEYIYMAEGTYNMPANTSGKTFTLIGSSKENTILKMLKTGGNNPQYSAKNVTYKKMTVERPNSIYQGMNAEVEYAEDCILKGLHFLYSTKISYLDCQFDANGAEHCVWTYGCSDVHFTDCSFKYSDRGVNCYSDQGIQYTEATFEGCTFTKVPGKETTGALETNSSIMTGLELNINDCTVNEGKLWFIPQWDSKNGEKTVVNINGNRTVASDKQLLAAVNAGATDIYVEGSFKMPSSGTSNVITITSLNGNATIDNTLGSYWDSATLTFNNVNFKTGTGKANGNGSDYAALYSKNVTYKKCNFSGPMRLGRDGAKFIDCTFNDLGNDYVWTYGNAASFNGCTFNSAGKALLIYSDGGNGAPAVSVTGCTFNATTGAKAGAISNQNCAAIEIHNYGYGVTLTTSGNTVETTGEKFSGEWRIKTYETRNADSKIFVNGTEYTTLALDGKTMTINGTVVTVQD